MSHFIALQCFSSDEIKTMLESALEIKQKASLSSQKLKGKSIGLLFEKPSLRTKTAFYIGALQLGAQAIYYTPQEIQLGEREEISDVARTLASYLDAVVLRTFSHETIVEFAKSSSIPVINGLSDFLHPSQALADVLTVLELKGDVKNVKLAYIGDGNNVCHSLLYCLAILGGTVTVATPEHYEPHEQVIKEVEALAQKSGARIQFTTSAQEAASGADVLYADVWVSMGSKDEAVRKKAFKNLQINDTIVSLAKKDCIVMHCLPAHRGEEITDSVIDGEHSVVFRQAENRLHTAKAILLAVFKQ